MKNKKIIMILLSLMTIGILTGCGSSDVEKNNNNSGNNDKNTTKSLVDDQLVDSSIKPQKLTYKTGAEGCIYTDKLYVSKDGDDIKYFLEKGFPIIFIEKDAKLFGKYTNADTNHYHDEDYYNDMPLRIAESIFYNENETKVSVSYEYYTPKNRDIDPGVFNFGDSKYFNKIYEDKIKPNHVYVGYSGAVNYGFYERHGKIINSLTYKNNTFSATSTEFDFEKDSRVLYFKWINFYQQLTDHTGIKFVINCEKYVETYYQTSIKLDEYKNECNMMLNDVYELYGITEQIKLTESNGTDISQEYADVFK